MSNESSCEKKSKDSDLDELLDSALQDFDVVNKSEKKEESEEKSEEKQNNLDNFAQIASAIDDLKLNDSDNKDKVVNDMLGENWIDEMLQEINLFKSDNPEFHSAILQTLNDLQQTTENLQNSSPLMNEDLASMFDKIFTDENQASEVLSFMKGAFKSILTKEVIYPVFKKLVDEYPSWLEEKKDSLDDEDLQRYTKQLSIMEKVCNDFQTEQADDSDVIKDQRFERIFNWIQEIQSCGEPPEELCLPSEIFQMK